ncbi:hypothetical protein BKA69DRAFT_1126488 [Paraphysoderma sedebokerense]|nr:hypothetical protein BKA69DRAFT_1126488 [Paraphysoderma sedebokerense]
MSTETSTNNTPVPSVSLTIDDQNISNTLKTTSNAAGDRHSPKPYSFRTERSSTLFLRVMVMLYSAIALGLFIYNDIHLIKNIFLNRESFAQKKSEYKLSGYPNRLDQNRHMLVVYSDFAIFEIIVSIVGIVFHFFGFFGAFARKLKLVKLSLTWNIVHLIGYAVIMLTTLIVIRVNSDMTGFMIIFAVFIPELIIWSLLHALGVAVNYFYFLRLRHQIRRDKRLSRKKLRHSVATVVPQTNEV